MRKIFNLFRSYITAKGDIDESIIIVTIIFIIEMYVLLMYVARGQDMPINITNYLEYIWAGSVGLYIAKAVSNIWRKKCG